MKLPKSNARKSLVLTLRALACELHTLACEVENFDQLENVKSRTSNLSQILHVLKSAAWEVQQNRFNAALEYLQLVQSELGNAVNEIAPTEPELPNIA